MDHLKYSQYVLKGAKILFMKVDLAFNIVMFVC